MAGRRPSDYVEIGKLCDGAVTIVGTKSGAAVDGTVSGTIVDSCVGGGPRGKTGFNYGRK